MQPLLVKEHSGQNFCAVNTVQKISSEQLLNGKREIIIQHGAEEYRLKVTGAGKLLLMK